MFYGCEIYQDGVTTGCTTFDQFKTWLETKIQDVGVNLVVDSEWGSDTDPYHEPAWIGRDVPRTSDENNDELNEVLVEEDIRVFLEATGIKKKEAAANDAWSTFRYMTTCHI